MHSIEIDKARAFIYKLLSNFLVEDYTKTKVDEIKSSLEILKDNSFSQDVSDSCDELLKYLDENSYLYIYKEYQELFLIPFGYFTSLSVSWYHEKREGGIMQLKVKDVLAKT